MPNALSAGISPEVDTHENSLTIEVSLDARLRAMLEGVASREAKTLSGVVESILTASMSNTFEEIENACQDDGENFGDEWQRLTNEILSLEAIRRRVIQLADQDGSLRNSSEQLLCLMDFHEQKIIECEWKLEQLISRCKIRPVVSEMLAERA